MADNRKFTMQFKVIAMIVLAICAVYFTWNVIDLTSKGNRLKKVCTESVMGNVWMLDYDKTHSTYTDAVYDLNGVRYHAYDLKQSGDDLDRPIIVYDSSNSLCHRDAFY